MNVYTLNDTVYKDVFTRRGERLEVKYKHHISQPEMVYSQNFREDKSVENEGWFLNKQKTGIWNYFGAGGKITIIKTYENDKETHLKRFYSNGNLKKEVGILDNNFHGVCKYYSKEGALILEGKYLKGRRKGNFIYFNSDGIKYNTCHYSNNILEGHDSIFKNGKLAKIFTYENGKRNGPVYYFRNDSIINEAYYRNDTIFNEPEEYKIYRDTFKNIQVMPEFITGEAGMMKFIAENLEYPDEAKDNGIDGRVHIQFTIRADGTVFDVYYFNKEILGYGCERAAIEVIESMPDWKPGRQDGKQVQVYFNIPIRFRLF